MSFRTDLNFGLKETVLYHSNRDITNTGPFPGSIKTNSLGGGGGAGLCPAELQGAGIEIGEWPVSYAESSRVAGLSPPCLC